MSTKRTLLKKEALQNSLDLFEQIINETELAKGDTIEATQQALDAATEALSSAGVNPDFISYEIDILPDSTGVEDGDIGAYFTTDGLFQKLQWNDSESEWDEIGEPISTKKYVDDKASLLQSEISAASQGIKPFATKSDMDAFTPGDNDDDREIAQVMNDPTTGNNGTYRWDSSATEWVKRDSLAEVKDVKGWVSNILDGYGVDIESLEYSDNDNIESGGFTWPDGESGSFSDLDEDSDGDLVSIRLNRPDSKYITVFSNGNLTATGF